MHSSFHAVQQRVPPDDPRVAPVTDALARAFPHLSQEVYFQVVAQVAIDALDRAAATSREQP